MDTTFVNSKKSKKSDPHWLLLNLADKINWKRTDKYHNIYHFSLSLFYLKDSVIVNENQIYQIRSLSNLSISYAWKNVKKVLKK